MNWPVILLIANCAATLYMVGLIWVVQLVHYPLFALVGAENAAAYQKRHQMLMTIVVGPAMLIEAFSAVLLVMYPPTGIAPWMTLTGVALVFVIWISTAVLQVPCHGRLADGFDAGIHHRLVTTNWIRTVAWSTRGVLVIWMVTLGLVPI